MEIEIGSDIVPTSPTAESGCNHSHNHNPIKRLIVVGAICFLFMIVEIVGGYLANSLAIMTDAAHLLSDLVSFTISIASLFIAKLPASSIMSYGYYRAEIIGALLSVSLIWGLTIWLLFEAVHRIIDPQEVDGQFMLVTAVFGLLCNIIMAKVLHSSPGHSHSHSHSHNHNHFQTSSHESPGTSDNNREKNSLIHHHHHHSHMENVNIRAAFLHILGDLLQSIGVIIAAVIIVIEPEWQIADPICTFLFSIIVVFTTVPITKQAISVLMEASPIGINLEELNSDLQSVIYN
jgi:zinc transporter 2